MKKFALIGFLLYTGFAGAQQKVAITEKEKRAVIDSVASKLQQYYVFPEKATAMAQYLHKRNSQKAYAAINDYKAFVDTLAGDLQRTHTDRHMNLMYNPARVQEVRQWRSGPEPSAALVAARRKADSKTNYGFVKTELLPGNIGYIDFRQFYNVNEGSKNTVAAAMGFIANADAAIIDLRQNGGGEPEMVQLILSYFTDEKPVLYNTLYNRPADTTASYYTLASVQGKKMPDLDLYILTSQYTFSGAEEFAYDLKNLKRATIIGETTGGGAHPTDLYVINDNVVMAIPFERAISPFTKTNWEGTGVEPHVKIEASKALLKAQQLALQKIAASATDSDTKAQAAWNLVALNAQLTPVTIPDTLKAGYAGTYGERNVTFENGDLFYQRGKQPKLKLLALAEDLFTPEGAAYLRLQFVRNKGAAEKLVALYENGEQNESLRTAKTF